MLARVLAAFLPFTFAINGTAQWVIADPTFPSGGGPDAPVKVIAVEPDGRILVGGAFTNLAGAAHGCIARFGTNWLVDTEFMAQLDRDPSGIQPLPDGRILVCGSFTKVNGVARPGLARLQPDGALDEEFVPPSDLTAGSINAAAASTNGIWICGNFIKAGGRTLNRVAKLTSTGAVDPAFTSPFAAEGYVTLLAVQPDGKPIISGAFTNLGGVGITNLVRLNSDGAVDTSFRSPFGSTERFSRALLLPNGQLIAAVATYADYGLSVTAPRLVRLNPDGSLDSTFQVGFESPGQSYNSGIYSLSLQQDGKILVSGTFLKANGVPRGKLARLTPDGTLDYCFDVAMGGDWYPLAVAPVNDGSIIVGASGGSVQGLQNPYLLRLLPPPDCTTAVIEMAVPAIQVREDGMRAQIPLIRHGGLDRVQTVTFGTRYGSAVPGTDYQAVIGTITFTKGERSQSIFIPVLGDTSTEGPETFEVFLTKAQDGALLGDATNVVVTLTDSSKGTAGAPDTNFVIRLNGAVETISPLDDGRVVIGGTFTKVNDQATPHLVRLRADGTVETPFLHAQGLDGPISSVTVDSTGRTLVAGDFQNVDGVRRPGLVRFDANGVRDDGFAPFDSIPTNSYYHPSIWAVTTLADGSVVCAGDLPIAEGSRGVLLRLSENGIIDQAFTNHMPQVEIYQLEPSRDGGFYAWGTGLGSSLSKLKSDGTLDPGFIPSADRQSTYYSGRFSLLPDGRIVVAGAPSWAYGLPSAGPLWRLNPDGSTDVGFQIQGTSFETLESVDALATSADGRVLVSGAFSTPSGSGFTALRRFHADGSVDRGFDPGTGLTAKSGSYAAANAIAVLPSGGWLIGGDFSGYNGFTQANLVKVLAETLNQPLSFSFNVTNLDLVETNTSLSFEVRRGGDASEPASVVLATASETAMPGSDYRAIMTNLVFAAGEWARRLSVDVFDDKIVEGTEQFSIRLLNPSSGFIVGTPGSIKVSITNDDAQIEFTKSQFAANEENGFAAVNVKWGGALSTNLSAQMNITPLSGDGTVILTNATVRYGRDSLSGTNVICVPLRDDAEHQATRMCRLELSASGNLSVGARSNAWLAVSDGDFSTTPGRGIAGVVEAIAKSPQGGVYLGGDFSSVHGEACSRVARLNASGLLDHGFDPGTGPDGNVTALAVQSDGKVLIAGSFASVNGTPRAGLARLNTDGSLDQSFDAGQGIKHTNGAPFVRVLLPQGDGAIWVAGAFTHMNSRFGRHLAKLQTNGSVDTTFVSPFPRTDSSSTRPMLYDPTAIHFLLPLPDGSLLAAGDLTMGYDFLATTPPSVVKLSPTGKVDKSFTNAITQGISVFALAAAPDGKLLLGVSRTSGLVPIVRMNTNGTGDRSFQITGAPPTTCDSEARQLLVQEDGRILFTAALFEVAPIPPYANSENPVQFIIARLLPDGAWDKTFTPLYCDLPLLRQQGPFWFNAPVTSRRTFGQIVPTGSLVQQRDGVLVLAGAFDSINGEPRRRLARFDPDWAVRGRMTLRLAGTNPLRLLLPPEVESPYVLEASEDLVNWYPWLEDGYPWWPIELSLAPNEPARYFRAKPLQ